MFFADEIRVDPAAGRDANDGRAQPVQTIARAIHLAQPGDTIHLAPGRYFASADFISKRGQPSRPITLEGHGAVLDGSEPVRAADWEALGGGLFRKVKLLPVLDDFTVSRWFFIWNGRVNRMDRCSKGPRAPFKKPADLQPGEWTFVKAEAAFYLRIPPGVSLDEANIRYPARANGVALSGASRHLVIREVIATHVFNDGFNIHGSERDCVFENIAAIECGDDGFSAHEDAECRIDGLVSIGNATGITDIASSVTHFRNVVIRDCVGYDVFFIGDSPHSIENALVESRAVRPLEISQHPGRIQKGLSAVRLTNVQFRRTAGLPGDARVNQGAKLVAGRCTFDGLNVHVTPGGEVWASDCLFTGEPKPELLLFPGAFWRGTRNAFDLRSLRVEQTVFGPETFADFQSRSGTDPDSRWGRDPHAGASPMHELEQRAEATLQRWRETK